MAQSQQGVFPELEHLPAVGTAARREWDQTIRQANELYPDWAWISVDHARFDRATYEKYYKEHHASPETRSLTSCPSPSRHPRGPFAVHRRRRHPGTPPPGVVN